MKYIYIEQKIIHEYDRIVKGNQGRPIDKNEFWVLI